MAHKHPILGIVHGKYIACGVGSSDARVVDRRWRLVEFAFGGGAAATYLISKRRPPIVPNL